jgi:hypothetical protein
MKRWLRFSLWAVAGVFAFVIITFAVIIWLAASPPRTYRKVGGHWSSATEMEFIAESGRKPRYLVRGMFFRKTVAKDLTDVQYLGDDCLVYTVVATNQDDLYAGCGDLLPVLLDHVPDHQKISLVSDPLQLNGRTMSVAEVKRRATRRINYPD